MPGVILQVMLISISVFVYMFIIFNFCERMYRRVYDLPVVYISAFIVSWFLLTFVNLYGVAAVNLAAYSLVILFTGIALYDANKGSDILSLFLLIMFLPLTELVGQLILAFVFAAPFSVQAGSGHRFRYRDTGLSW